MRTSVLKQSQQPGGAVISLSPLGNVFSLSRCVELKTNENWNTMPVYHSVLIVSLM